LTYRRAKSEASLERYELLQAIARGDNMLNPASPAAKYILAKHGDYQALIGIHPEGHLTFALLTTKESLKRIEPLVKAKKAALNIFYFNRNNILYYLYFK